MFLSGKHSSTSFLARNENSNPKKQKFHAKALRDRKEKPLRILCVSAPTRRGALLIFFFWFRLAPLDLYPTGLVRVRLIVRQVSFVVVVVYW